MENNLENAKTFFEENNMECFTPQEMNVIGKTMCAYTNALESVRALTKKNTLSDSANRFIQQLMDAGWKLSSEEQVKLLDAFINSKLSE